MNNIEIEATPRLDHAPAPSRPSLWPRIWRTTVMVMTYLVLEIVIKGAGVVKHASPAVR